MIQVILLAKIHFEEDGTQNYLVFQARYRYFKVIAGVNNGSYIYYWKSKGLSDKRINSIKTPNHSITPNLDYYGTKTRVEFNRTCLKQDKVTSNHRKVVSIYNVYEVLAVQNPTVANCLFGAVSLNKNADIDKYKCFGYEIRFERHGRFSFPGTGLA